ATDSHIEGGPADAGAGDAAAEDEEGKKIDKEAKILKDNAFTVIQKPNDQMGDQYYVKRGDKRIIMKIDTEAKTDKKYYFWVQNVSEGNSEVASPKKGEKEYEAVTLVEMIKTIDGATAIDATKGMVEDLKYIPGRESTIEPLTGTYKVGDKEIPYEANTYK